jgi:hypothetical protein
METKTKSFTPYTELSLHDRINTRGIMGNYPWNPNLLTKQDRGDIKQIKRMIVKQRKLWNSTTS